MPKVDLSKKKSKMTPLPGNWKLFGSFRSFGLKKRERATTGYPPFKGDLTQRVLST